MYHLLAHFLSGLFLDGFFLCLGHRLLVGGLLFPP